MTYSFPIRNLRTERAIREKLLISRNQPVLISHLGQQIPVLVKKRSNPVYLSVAIRELSEQLSRNIKHTPHPIRLSILQSPFKNGLFRLVLVILLITHRNTIGNHGIIKTYLDLVYLILKLTIQLSHLVLLGSLIIIIRYNLSLKNSSLLR